MATSDILGLFTSPEQYQAQQLAQQQANEQTRAINFANLDPRQQANYGTFLGAQQLGRGFAGLLGVQDPQLQRIRQRAQLMQSINPADPESLMAGIQAATNAGDQELALTLTDFMREQESKIQLGRQRQAAAEKDRTQALPAGVQEAELIGQYTEQLQKTTDPNVRAVIQAKIKRLEKNLTKADELEDLFAAEQDAIANARAKAAQSQAVGPDGLPTTTQAAVNVDDDPRVKAVRARIKTLTATAGDKTFESIAKAERIGTLTNELAALAAAGKKDTNEYRNKAAILKSLEGGGGSKEVKEIVIADQIVALEKLVREAKDPNAPEVLDAKAKVGVLRAQLKGDRPNLTVVGEIKSGVDKGKPVYVDEVNDQQFIYSKDSSGKQVRKLVSDVDVDRMTSQTNISATASMPPGERKFVEKLGALDADDVAAARANRNNSIAALNTLSELSRLNQSGVTSGAFADGRVGAVNLLNTLGLVSSRDVGVLANSQTFNKVAGDLILATLGGKLGAGFSNEDRKFIAGLVPSLETSREARQQLITFMTKKNQLIIDEATRLEDYARENSGLKGFKAKIPIVNAPASGSLQAMSESELKAAIEKAKQKKEGK